MQMVRLLACPILIVSVLSISGCSSDVATVKGQVTLDKKPLAGATVNFFPEDGGRPSSALTNSDGTYELGMSSDVKGAKVGKHKVKITASTERGNEEIPQRVPPRYNTNTQLVKEVNPGENTIDFHLSSAGYIPGMKQHQPNQNDCE